MGDLGDQPTVRFADGPVDPEPGQVYVFACEDEAGRRVRSLLLPYDPADPFAGTAAAERALDEARRRLDLPAPEPGLNPPGDQLVGVATWLWVEGPWQDLSATAAIGAVAATVTARPVSVQWDLGDGTTLTCDAGTRYDPARPPADQSSRCTHVFGHSSAGRPSGVYSVTASVSYSVSWTANTGAGGALDGLTRSSTVAVRVVEAQAVIR